MNRAARVSVPFTAVTAFFLFLVAPSHGWAQG